MSRLKYLTPVAIVLVLFVIALAQAPLPGPFVGTGGGGGSGPSSSITNPLVIALTGASSFTVCGTCTTPAPGLVSVNSAVTQINTSLSVSISPVAGTATVFVYMDPNGSTIDIGADNSSVAMSCVFVCNITTPLPSTAFPVNVVPIGQMHVTSGVIDTGSLRNFIASTPYPTVVQGGSNITVTQSGYTTTVNASNNCIADPTCFYLDTPLTVAPVNWVLPAGCIFEASGIDVAGAPPVTVWGSSSTCALFFPSNASGGTGLGDFLSGSTPKNSLLIMRGGKGSTDDFYTGWTSSPTSVSNGVYIKVTTSAGFVGTIENGGSTAGSCVINGTVDLASHTFKVIVTAGVANSVQFFEDANHCTATGTIPPETNGYYGFIGQPIATTGGFYAMEAIIKNTGLAR